MKLLLVIVSYILLSTLGPMLYAGLVLLFVAALKKVFNMNEDKWERAFKWRKGREMFYVVLLFPYGIMLAIMFWLSKIWFEFINFEYSVLASTSIVVLMALTVLLKLPKLKEWLNNK